MRAARVAVVMLLVVLLAAAGVVAYRQFGGSSIMAGPTIPPVSGAHKARLEAYGACMRRHGIAVELIFHGAAPGANPPNVVEGTGWQMVLPKGVDVRSAPFQAAAAACTPAGGLYWPPASPTG